MARQSIQQSLIPVALEGITDNHTITAYKKDCKAFATFCRSEGIKTPDKLREDPLGALQSYERTLEAQHYSAQTIHRYLAAPAKALGVDMKDISKPRRTSGQITRGRDEEANAQGRAEATQERFARLMEFQSVVGIRRAELGHLRGRDLCKDESGKWCVRVESGKGGKEQYQRILPEDLEVVARTFRGVDPDKAVFSEAEMKNKINLHGIRAEHARETYKYYLDKIQNDPDRAQELRLELVARWKTAHPEGNAIKFQKIITNRSPYRLRGENRKKALAEGRPIEYNRLALMAVSVFHLSHWRLDVTATNYMV